MLATCAGSCAAFFGRRADQHLLGFFCVLHADDLHGLVDVSSDAALPLQRVIKPVGGVGNSTVARKAQA